MTREVMDAMTCPRHRAGMTTILTTPFGARLREWRGVRRLTQEALGGAARVSPRHLSCLEGGRAMPSEVMVLRLAEALDMPLRERNALLAAAGYAPRYAGRRGTVPAALAPVITQLIESQPHPAYLLDGGFDVLEANAPALALLAPFAPTSGQADGERLNVARLLIGSPALRGALANWEDTARAFVARLRNDCAAQGPRSPLTALLAELEADPQVAAALARAPSDPVAPVLPLVLNTPAGPTRWLTLLMSFGAPQDAMVEHLTIEQLLPADDATRAFLATL